MAIAKITTWINDTRRDYQYGLLLYNQYGKSELLKVFFKNGNSSYHQDRLITVLEELNQTLEDLTNKSDFIIPTVEQIVIPLKRYGVTDEAWDKYPDQIKDLYVNNSKLHAHSTLLFTQARIASSDEERRVLGTQILKERRAINNNWKSIKDFCEKGKVKEQLVEQEQVTIDELSISDLTKQLANIPTYLSRDRKKCKTMAPGSKLNKVLLRIQENETKIELIKKRLEEMK